MPQGVRPHLCWKLVAARISAMPMTIPRISPGMKVEELSAAITMTSFCLLGSSCYATGESLTTLLDATSVVLDGVVPVADDVLVVGRPLHHSLADQLVGPEPEPDGLARVEHIDGVEVGHGDGHVGAAPFIVTVQVAVVAACWFGRPSTGTTGPFTVTRTSKAFVFTSIGSPST
jgi:hypothetical protein